MVNHGSCVADETELQSELDDWQIPGDQQHTILSAQRIPAFELWPENWPVFEWWSEVADLLKWQGSVCMGLDVVALNSHCHLSQSPCPPKIYQQLRIVAAVVSEELNKRVK